jgi:hypothetical protein
MAARIAKSAPLIVPYRPKASVIPIGPRNDDHGASLGCGGKYGMTLRATRRLPDGEQPQEWFVFAGSILIEYDTAEIRDGIQECIKDEKHAP